MWKRFERNLLLCVLFLIGLAVSACSGGSKGKQGDGIDPCAAVTCEVGVCVDGVCTSVGNDVGGDAGNNGEDDMGTDMTLPDRCNDGTLWAPGTTAFENSTEAAGFAEISADGVRVAAADVDGDGYPDLAVRRAGRNSDDFSQGGERAHWLLRNRGDGTFEDITKESGIVKTRYGTDDNVGRPAEVFAFADVDNDGDLDAFTGFSNDGSSFEGSEIMLNDGAGSFEFGPADTPFHRKGEKASIAGASFVDLDRDGLIDLWLGQGAVDRQPQPDMAVRQVAEGDFESVASDMNISTESWGSIQALNQAEAHSNAWAANACDLDGDGTAELLASSYGRAPNLLWLSDADGQTYTNHSVESGYAYDDRTDWSDNESARCYCKYNRSAEGCSDVPEPEHIQCNSAADAFRWNHDNDRELYRLGGNSGTTVCADINNDGHLDLLTTTIVHWDVGSSSDPSEILYNTGGSTLEFERPGNDVTGLARDETVPWDHGDMTGAVFDFDNDGRPDIYIGSSDYPGTRGWLFHQKEDGTFEQVPFAEGIDHTRSHGIAIADYDRDGDLDVVVGHSRFRCGNSNDCYDEGHVRYWENVYGEDGNWIQLDLEGGEGTNRAAIGARVTVTAGGITQTQEINGGHGHYGIQHDRVLHFGLGEACEAEVTVRWPDADLTEQTFTVSTGYRYHVAQGQEPETTQ